MELNEPISDFIN